MLNNQNILPENDTDVAGVALQLHFPVILNPSQKPLKKVVIIY